MVNSLKVLLSNYILMVRDVYGCKFVMLGIKIVGSDDLKKDLYLGYFYALKKTLDKENKK